MSPREKKLLTLFATAGFVVINLVGLSAYKKKAVSIADRKVEAMRVLQELDMFQASSEERLDEMDWLRNHLPDPAEYENVQTALQAFCEAEASRFNLALTEIPLRNRQEQTGGHFQRVRMNYKLTGLEQDLYRWLDRINMPNQFRASTRLILSPNKEDDTRIDCQATVEQWFIPVSSSV
ncbi:MAG: hypothetical protein ACPGIA_01435 [Luteolibacter sp.]